MCGRFCTIEMESELKLEKPKAANLLKMRTLGMAGGLAVGVAFSASAAYAYSGQELAGQAKIGIAQARVIALHAHAGKIVSEELEKEAGGSGLRYSFDIKKGAVTQEVGVDAQSGKILENVREGPHPD
jgi:hypothetical protein